MATVLFHCGRFVCFPVATGKDEKRTEQFLSRHPFCSAVSCLNSSVIPPGSAVKQGDYLFNNKKVGWVIWVSASPLLIFFFQLKKKKRHSQSGWNTWVNNQKEDLHELGWWWLSPLILFLPQPWQADTRRPLWLRALYGTCHTEGLETRSPRALLPPWAWPYRELAELLLSCPVPTAAWIFSCKDYPAPRGRNFCSFWSGIRDQISLRSIK